MLRLLAWLFLAPALLWVGLWLLAALGTRNPVAGMVVGGWMGLLTAAPFLAVGGILLVAANSQAIRRERSRRPGRLQRRSRRHP